MTVKPKIYIDPAFKGYFTVNDLLHSEGTIILVLKTKILDKKVPIFSLYNDEYVFKLSLQNKHLLIQRNETVSAMTLDKLIELDEEYSILTLRWSTTELFLACNIGHKAEVKTRPTIPPPNLIEWARKTL